MATSIPAKQVDTVIVACEAGMGSSVMCVSAMKKKLKAAGLDVKVVHSPVRALTASAKLVLVHRGLLATARKTAPGAVVVAFDHFMNDPVFDTVVKTLAAGGDVVEVG
ncbi:MAG: hypothetical protein QM767_14565 [Anaeromyxobacter sp.]